MLAVQLGRGRPVLQVHCPVLVNDVPKNQVYTSWPGEGWVYIPVYIYIHIYIPCSILRGFPVTPAKIQSLGCNKASYLRSPTLVIKNRSERQCVVTHPLPPCVHVCVRERVYRMRAHPKDSSRPAYMIQTTYSLLCSPHHQLNVSPSSLLLQHILQQLEPVCVEKSGVLGDL